MIIPMKIREEDSQVERANIQYIPAYVSELRQRTGYYLSYIPNEYADQPTKDNYYEVIRKDPEIKRCSNLFAVKVAGERLHIQSKTDKRLELIVAAIFDNIKNFQHVKKSLIEKGMVFGLAIQKKSYKRISLRNFPGLVWEMIDEVREVDRRRLRIERLKEDKNQTYWTIWNPQYDSYVKIMDRKTDPQAPIAMQDFVWFFDEHEELFPYFEGLGECLYLLAYIKTRVLQYWTDLCESWAKPFLVVATDLMKGVFNANLGQGFVSKTKRVSDLLDTFEKTRSRHIAVIDKSDELQYHERGSVGANMLKELIGYCDAKIQLLFFGTELATEAGNYGSYKLGAIHHEETNKLAIYQRSRLEDVLLRDIVFDTLYRNRFNLSLLGIPFPEKQDLVLTVEDVLTTEKLLEMAGN